MFADPLDTASYYEEQRTAEAIQRQSRLAAPEQKRDDDGNWETTECVMCDRPIEEGRLELGKIRCFSCQSALERKGKFYAR